MEETKGKGTKKQKENKGNCALVDFEVGKGLVCIEESRETGGGAGVLPEEELAGHQNYLESLCLAAEYVHFWGYLWSVASVQAGCCSA